MFVESRKGHDCPHFKDYSFKKKTIHTIAYTFYFINIHIIYTFTISQDTNTENVKTWQNMAKMRHSYNFGFTSITMTLGNTFKQNISFVILLTV